MKSNTLFPSTTNANRDSNKAVSYFEFWPTWIIYTPVALQWLWLAIRYRSMTLPLIANPHLTVSGMVGVAKSELMQQASGECDEVILNWEIHRINSKALESQLEDWLQRLQQQKIDFPFVCKPDIGCRGSGVKLVKDKEQLLTIMAHYPNGSTLMAQKLASWEPEAGIFFVRRPNERYGKIESLTLKYNPSVVGNGVDTLEELVKKDNRASKLISIYKQRHLQNWEAIIPLHQYYSLVFSSSHCRGAIFRDARHLITEALTEKINQIMQGLPEFHYGRLDVKFLDIASLQAGENLEIVEINGASAESIHIWDKDASLISAIKTLLWQYNTLFQIGSINRQRGFKTPAIKTILKLWHKERKLTKHYPSTD